MNSRKAISKIKKHGREVTYRVGQDKFGRLYGRIIEITDRAVAVVLKSKLHLMESPEHPDLIKLKRTESAKTVVCLDAKYLATMQEIFESKAVELHIREDDHIEVHPINDSGLGFLATYNRNR